MSIRGICGFILAVLPPLAAAADDAAAVFEEMRQKQIARSEGVDAYMVTREMSGHQVTEYYQRFELEGDDGLVYPVFQRVPAENVSCGSQSASKLSPEELEAYARALETGGDAMAGEVEDGLEEAGLPRGLFTGLGAGGDPWATTDMRRMTGTMATFARGAAAAERERAAAPEVTAQDASGQLEFARKAELVGMEELDGRTAYHLRADELNQTQESDGQTYTIDTMSLWIDTGQHVPLKLRMDGIATSGGESRELYIEKIDSDYRQVPDSDLYESYRQVMSFGGVMDESQQAQMEQARQQMVEFEKQMAKMPESQRQMMEQMMGPQLDTMRKLAAGGGLEIETTNITRLRSQRSTSAPAGRLSSS